jgi:hypothetical protein
LCYSLSKGPFARISPPYNPLSLLVGINGSERSLYAF